MLICHVQFSFDQLYNQLNKKIFNVALHYVQNIEDAEEITADVFVDVYRKLEQFRGEAAIETWVYRITVNKSLDFLRHKNRQKRKGFMITLFGKDDATLEIPSFHHPGVAAEQKENAQILYAGINRLQENQRTAFILVYVEELPQKEVAEVMQLSVKAVESLLQRAKTQLRKILQKEFEVRRKS